MKKNNYWILIALIVLVALVYSQMQSSGNMDYDALAQCLTASGAKMYGAFWCGHCNEQKDAFGNAWEHVEYIECSTGTGQQTEFCAEAGIKGYPTWEFEDGSRISGKLSFDKLKSKTSC